MFQNFPNLILHTDAWAFVPIWVGIRYVETTPFWTLGVIYLSQIFQKLGGRSDCKLHKEIVKQPSEEGHFCQCHF